MAQPLNAVINEILDSLPELSVPLDAQKEAVSLRSFLLVLQDRFQHADKPLLLVMCGPTGAGKSHLFNFLAGDQLSPSSYKRPSTVAPVLAKASVNNDVDDSFFKKYKKCFIAGSVVFDQKSDGNIIYVVNIGKPPWGWPDTMILIDTPDFDSVMAHNEDQALDMAARSDAMILVVHQAKYADQSIWDFLAHEKKYKRPLLIVLNRVTAEAVYDDFQQRLRQENIKADVIVWPEETAVGAPRLIMAHNELTNWLEERGAESRKLVADASWQTFEQVKELMDGFFQPRWRKHQAILEQQLKSVTSIIKDWSTSPQTHLSLNLPGETKEALLNNLSTIVSRSDIWAAPRRFMAKPFALAGDFFKKIFAGESGLEASEKKISSGLADASREALAAAVHDQARALAASCELDMRLRESLSLTDDEIHSCYQEMSEHMEQWLKEESTRLLSGLPLGQKAVFYFVQLVHITLILGLLLQTGGIPGTELLVGGAFGPVISKLTGGVISREAVATFEQRARAEHNKILADIFTSQGQRFLFYLNSAGTRLKAGEIWAEGLKAIEKEARRLWS